MEERLMSQEPTVQIQEHASRQGMIGHMTLTVPATLNSLTLTMVDQIQSTLEQWRDRSDIAVILIDGSGDKAFCAGGDVQALRDSCLASPGGPCDYAETFFTREYRMNFTLHTYPKPIICWSSGIVMGGGLGILAGCRLRIVTETTRIAMPEVTIALFPDVGGSWFLNRMPGGTGLFLGLTGASINAGDALYTGIANRFMSADQRPQLLHALSQVAWTAEPNQNGDLARGVVHSLSLEATQEVPESLVEQHRAVIDDICDTDQILTLGVRIKALSDSSDRWLAKAAQGFANGSPLAARWIAEQLRRTRHCSLAEVFQAEIVLGTNIMRHPEFAEGVRALLVDKDRSPQWTYSSLESVPAQVLETFFNPPWTHNPLADLTH